jgi:hypothetical protein
MKLYPLGRGLRVMISESGEPLSIGAPLDEAVARVEEWIAANHRNPRVGALRLWLESVDRLQRQSTVQARAQKIAKAALDKAARIENKELRKATTDLVTETF